MNSFALHAEYDESGDIRVWTFIDGEKKFQVGIECLQDCFLTRDPVSDDSCIKAYLINPAFEKIIDYGFCVEDCCESTIAEVHYDAEFVRWTSIRTSIAESSDNSIEYVFDRCIYDTEINQCISAMAQHLRSLYHNLRYPIKAEQVAP